MTHSRPSRARRSNVARANKYTSGDSDRRMNQVTVNHGEQIPNGAKLVKRIKGADVWADRQGRTYVYPDTARRKDIQSFAKKHRIRSDAMLKSSRTTKSSRKKNPSALTKDFRKRSTYRKVETLDDGF